MVQWMYLFTGESNIDHIASIVCRYNGAYLYIGKYPGSQTGVFTSVYVLSKCENYMQKVVTPWGEGGRYRWQTLRFRN